MQQCHRRNRACLCRGLYQGGGVQCFEGRGCGFARYVLLPAHLVLWRCSVLHHSGRDYGGSGSCCQDSSYVGNRDSWLYCRRVARPLGKARREAGAYLRGRYRRGLSNGCSIRLDGMRKTCDVEWLEGCNGQHRLVGQGVDRNRPPRDYLWRLEPISYFGYSLPQQVYSRVDFRDCEPLR